MVHDDEPVGLDGVRVKFDARTQLAPAARPVDPGSDGTDDAKYTVEITRAEFPELQRLAQQSTLEIAVRNAGDEAIPNLAVAVHGLGERNPDLPDRTLWVVNSAPSVVTASTETWTAGRLDPGRTAPLRWVVTPIDAGNQMLSYTVAAALKGDVRAALANGTEPHGSIAVRVTDKAPKARVDPRTGQTTRDDGSSREPRLRTALVPARVAS